MPRTRREGFSLMEVLLATSILVGSTILLVELANQGNRNSEKAYLQAQAQILCQTWINELATGIRPLEAQEATPLEEAPGWTAEVEIQELPDRLKAVRVTIEQEENPRGQKQSYTLTRWLPDMSSGQQEAPLGSPAPQARNDVNRPGGF